MSFNKHLEANEELSHTAKHHCLAWLTGMFDGNSYVGSRYAITNKRIIFKKGILMPDIESIALNKVERVVPSQKWYQRIFGTGTVEIYGIGSSHFTLVKLSSPLLFFKRFESAQHNT